MTANSSLSAVAGSGTAPAFSNSTPLCTSSVASPPSSRIMFGPSPVGPASAPARCTTSTPRASRPSRRTPGCRRAGDRGRGVVLGGEDVARRPAHLGAERDERLDQHRGLDRHVQRAGDARARERLRVARTRSRSAIRPGISCSASSISLRPNSASERSATLKSVVQVGRGHRVSMSGVGGRSGPRRRAAAWCFSCSQRSQSRRGTSLGTLGLGLEPAVDARRAAPGRAAGARRRRRRTGRARARRAARAACAGAAARPARRGGSRTPSARARPARRARRSAASAATSRWSPPPRGSSARPSGRAV